MINAAMFNWHLLHTWRYRFVATRNRLADVI